MSIVPRYKHDDCSACHYLGQYDKYDLWTIRLFIHRI